MSFIGERRDGEARIDRVSSTACSKDGVWWNSFRQRQPKLRLYAVVIHGPAPTTPKEYPERDI